MVSSIGGAGLAQSLPARVDSRTTQAAQDTAAAASVAPANDVDTGTSSVQSAQSAATARVGGQLDAQFDAARVGGAGGTSGSASAPTDYIAEADTNKDRKVSEEERIAYEKKQASETQGDAGQSRAQEVQQAYLPQDSAGTQLDVEA